MNPRVLEPRPEDIVLDAVQSNNISIDAGNFLFPRALEQAAEVLDGFDVGIGAQDQLDGPGIVCVDVKGELFFGGERLRVDLLQDLEVPIQLGLLILETLIVHQAVTDIFLKQFSIETIVH